MNISFMKRGLWAMALLLTFTGSVMAQEVAPADPLALDAKAIKDAGIVLDKVAVRSLADELKAPGEVKVDAYSTVLVSPRVESQVLARKATLGDVVKMGQPLVVLSSVQVAETQGALIVAERDWQRIASLGPQAVSARRYYEAKVQRDQARAKLRAYGLSEGQVAGLLRKGSPGADGSFELLAPSEGRVATDEFLVGERVERRAERGALHPLEYGVLAREHLQISGLPDVGVAAEVVEDVEVLLRLPDDVVPVDRDEPVAPARRLAQLA